MCWKMEIKILYLPMIADRICNIVFLNRKICILNVYCIKPKTIQKSMTKLYKCKLKYYES